MRSFTQLTLADRDLIAKLISEGKTQTEIALILGRSQSSISREIRRTSHLSSTYLPLVAELNHIDARKRSVKNKRINDPLILDSVITGLKNKWSPEIIANTQPKNEKISTSTIYRALKRGDISELSEANCLRRKGKRKYCRGGGKTIQHGKSIHDRPLVTEKRARIGDWEGDTVLGAVGKGCLVTLIDRKTRLLMMALSKDKSAKTVGNIVIKLLNRNVSHSLTLDNGSEFADYEKIQKKTNVTVYFADTHSPWQRGSNENVNELIRWYFPKGTDFTKISNAKVQQVCNKINHRPRKILNWNTPADVFYNLCI